MDFISDKFNLEKKLFVININLAAMLAFVSFWSYGFFGALTAKSFGLAANIIISLVFCGIFVLFLWLWQNSDLYKDSIVIRVKDILVFMSFFLIMIVLSISNLTMPLNGDQLAHSQQSKLHGITLINFLSNKTDIFNNFSFKWLIYVVDLLIIAAGFAIYKFTKNKSWLFKVFIFTSLFLVFRFAIMAFGGSAGSHPPFRLFPLWATSAIFTSADFSFRLSQFIGFIVLIWLIQKISNKNLSFLNSWLFALAVGTIPVLWHVGILAEQSIWTAIIWTLFLLYIAICDKSNEFNYIRWVSVISVFTLFRQSAFIALLPLFLIIIVDLFKRKEFKAKKIFFLMSPIIVILPFLLNSFINGTPASYYGEISVFQRILIAFDSGIIFNAIMNSVGWPWITFLIIPLLFVLKNHFKILVALIFFISGVCVFYTITPGLWGMGRYQAEYIVPFVILGFFLFINLIFSRYNFTRKFLPLIFIPLIFYNIYIFKNLASFNKPIDELKVTFNKDMKIRKAYTVLSEFPYEYNQAFMEIKQTGYAGKTFVAGATYGVFGEMLNDFTVSEVKAEKQIYEKVKFNFSVENINKNDKIQLILISDFMDDNKLKNDLENLGWKKWKEFKNKKYGSTIISLIRGDDNSKFK